MKFLLIIISNFNIKLLEVIGTSLTNCNNSFMHGAIRGDDFCNVIFPEVGVDFLVEESIIFISKFEPKIAIFKPRGLLLDSESLERDLLGRFLKLYF